MQVVESVMNKDSVNAVCNLIVSAFCIAFLVSAVPIFGRQFEHWPLLACEIDLIVTFILPISSILAVIFSYKVIASGNKKMLSKFLLTLSVISCLFFIAYVRDFTSAP